MLYYIKIFGHIEVESGWTTNKLWAGCVDLSGYWMERGRGGEGTGGGEGERYRTVPAALPRRSVIGGLTLALVPSLRAAVPQCRRAIRGDARLLLQPSGLRSQCRGSSLQFLTEKPRRPSPLWRARGNPRAGEQLFGINLAGTDVKAIYIDELIQKAGNVKQWCRGGGN